MPGKLQGTRRQSECIAQLRAQALFRLTRCEIRREDRKSYAMRATVNNRRAIRLRTLVSRTATDLLASHLAGARQPGRWAVNLVENFFVNFVVLCCAQHNVTRMRSILISILSEISAFP